MATISIKTLQELFSNKKATTATATAVLPPIRIEPYTRDDDNTTVEPEGWIRHPLGPGGPMGLILHIKNPMYQSSTLALQKVLLRETVTDAQERAAALLRGRRWPSRRVSESISSCLLHWSDKAVQESENYKYTYSVICALEDVQLVVVDTDKKALQFFPEDVRVWQKDVPIHMMSHDGRWVFSHRGGEIVWPPSLFGAWISAMEGDGWAVSWPIAVGNMDVLREVLEGANIPIEGRIKKEELAKKVGRTQGIQLLGGW